MTPLVVLPSFNESANIETLIDAILCTGRDVEVCVVDDSSPDGTADVVSKRITSDAAWQGRVHLIVRQGKGGRGGAVRDGITWGIERGGYRAFVEMDCDHSHDPAELNKGLDLLDSGSDVVIGARYPNGTIVGWPTYRRVFSRIANYLARTLLEWSVGDYTNGYRFYSPESAKTLVASPQRHTGFIYLSEALAYLMRSGASVSSFPITFRDRSGGESSANLREVMNALTGLFAIAWWYRVTSR